MRKRITIVFNQPQKSRYDTRCEEKAVSAVLNAVAAVRRSLEELCYNISVLPLVPPLESVRAELMRLDTDLVFNLFEGFAGEPESEALVPEVLTERSLRFTGCSGGTLRQALDKVRIKALLRAAGVATPDFQVLNPRTLDTFCLNFPCIVKPRCDDASHGITDESVVYDNTSLKKQVTTLSRDYQNGVLVEHFIGGREFNVTVLGNGLCTVLPPSEIVYTLPLGKPQLLTFASKWEPDSPEYKGSNAVCPANVTGEENKHIYTTAMLAFQRLAGCGYARVDMRMDETGELNIIEINPNPDISPDAGAAFQAKAAGMSYTRFIDTIVKLGMEKKHAD